MNKICSKSDISCSVYLLNKCDFIKLLLFPVLKSDYLKIA